MRLTLRFDGSLRPAPPSCICHPTSLSSSAPTYATAFRWTSTSEPTEPLAACAATLHWDSDDDGGPALDFSCTDAAVGSTALGAGLVALAGKRLDASVVTRSGQAEYEGLLLGLNILREFLASDAVARGAAGVHPILDIKSIRIQGDCKTVVDQIRGRSRPRRLESYWSRAHTLLSCIETQLKCTSASPVVVAEHIPRENNTVCDELASRIVLRQHRIRAQELWRSIESYDARQPRTPTTLSIEELLSRVPRVVPASMRPMYYIRLAEAAWAASAYPELVLVGRQLENEVKSAISAGTHHLSSTELAIELHALSLALQIMGYEKSNQVKIAQRLRRRHRKLLDDAHPDLVRAMEASMNGDGSLSGFLRRRIDTLAPPLDEDPIFQPPLIGGDVDEWIRRAYTSKEWDKDGAYVLWFQ